jgi:hypothetical protein
MRQKNIVRRLISTYQTESGCCRWARLWPLGPRPTVNTTKTGSTNPRSRDTQLLVVSGAPPTTDCLRAGMIP